MNWYIVSEGAAIFSAIGLGLFVFLKNRNKLLNRYFFFMNLCIAAWNIGDFLVFISLNLSVALFWDRVSYLGAIFIVYFFVKFVYALVEKDLVNSNKFFFYIFNISTYSLIPIVFSQSFIKSVTIKPFRETTGNLYFLFILFFLILISHALFVLFKGYRKSHSFKKIQIKYVFIGLFLGFIAGIIYFLSIYTKVPPIHFFIEILYLLIIAYAILRYHFMDIEVIIRKTIVFAGLFTFIFGAFVSAAYLVQTHWLQMIGSQYLAMVITVSIIVLVQEPLKNLLVKYTDRFLLQKKYDYQKVLRDASEGMSMVREVKWLLGLITHIISSKMRVSNVGVFLQEDEADIAHYYLKAKRGKEPIQHTSLSNDNPICLWLQQNKKPLVLEEVDYLLQRKDDSSSASSTKNILGRIKNQMEGLNAKVIIPAFYKGRLLGLLTLGYKLSRDMYTKEDLILLSTLSNSAAVAIENAKLFDSLIEEIEINNHLRKEEEESYLQMMMSLAKTIDAKDPYTYDHVEMVYQYGIKLAEYFPNLNKDALKASLRLHDLGKIGVPDSILLKPGPLTPEEWKNVKEHTILGARILAPIKKFEYVAKIILHHQEKYDGTGYPAGLKGESIPLEARIISVIDAYHAMTSDRPYRKAMSKEAAITELKKCAGTYFDPKVVDAFLKMLKEKYGITAAFNAA